MYLKAIAFLLLLTIQHNSCVQGKVSVAVVTARLGQTTCVRLESAVSQGYSWELKDSSVIGDLKYIKQTYISDGGDQDGSNGIQEFCFLTRKKGEITLSFIYIRPWERGKTNNAPERTFRIKTI